MEVPYRLPCPGAIVQNQAVASFINSVIPRQLRGYQVQVADQALFLRPALGYTFNMLPGNDKDMGRGSRVNIIERQTLIIRVDHGGRNSAANNFTEQAVRAVRFWAVRFWMGVGCHKWILPEKGNANQRGSVGCHFISQQSGCFIHLMLPKAGC